MKKSKRGRLAFYWGEPIFLYELCILWVFPGLVFKIEEVLQADIEPSSFWGMSFATAFIGTLIIAFH